MAWWRSRVERKREKGKGGKGREVKVTRVSRSTRLISLSTLGQQHRPLDSRRHSWKRNLIREKLNSFKCTSSPSRLLTPPLLVPGPPTSLFSLSLFIPFFHSFPGASSKACCSFFTHPLQPFPSRKRRSAIYSFLSSSSLPTSVLTLLSLRPRTLSTLPSRFLHPLFAVRSTRRGGNSSSSSSSPPPHDQIPRGGSGEPTRDPPTSDCLTPLINLVEESRSLARISAALFLSLSTCHATFSFSLSLPTRRGF